MEQLKNTDKTQKQANHSMIQQLIPLKFDTASCCIMLRHIEKRTRNMAEALGHRKQNKRWRREEKVLVCGTIIKAHR